MSFSCFLRNDLIGFLNIQKSPADRAKSPQFAIVEDNQTALGMQTSKQKH